MTHYDPIMKSEVERFVLLVGEHGRITNRAYQAMCAVSYDTAHRDLRELVERGLIERRGSGRSTNYVLSI